tara:strand:- start:733 stop:963 length:231 start_codon:yes stop_codon:yes gene_type:complete
MTTKNTKCYIEIKFESHTYTATVTKFGDLSKFLSSKTEKFRIGNITGVPFKGLHNELNMISHFGHSLSKPATASWS